MADSILSSLLSQAKFSISVKAADGTSTVIAPNLKVIKAAAKYMSVAQRSIKEDGTTFVDSKTIKQTEFDLSVYCETVDDLRQVNDLLQNRSKLYTIYSKGLVFENMVLDSEVVKQSPEVLSAYPIELKFKEMIIQNIQPLIVKQVSDASVIPLGFASITVPSSQTVTTFIASVKTAAADASRAVTAAVSGLI